MTIQHNPAGAKELDGKVALVTGGGEGIGRATCLLFARQGASVGVLGRTRANIEETCRAIEREGGEALALEADISSGAETKAAIDKLTETYGRLDIVFAHAGINGVWAPIGELHDDEWDKTLKINLSGTFYTIRHVVPHLRAAGGGAVVITSSVNGTRVFSNSGATAYAASKAGQVAMGKCLALELAKHRIRVNLMCPGAIATEIGENTQTRDLDEACEPVEYPEGKIPLTDGKPGTPEDCAELVLFLCSDRSKHISGAVVHIDGTQSLLQG